MTRRTDPALYRAAERLLAAIQMAGDDGSSHSRWRRRALRLIREALADAAGVCASCRDHRAELEAAGEVIARLAGLLEKAEPYVAGGYPYGQAVREALARDIRAALGDHREHP